MSGDGVDSAATMSSWPVRVWEESEIPQKYRLLLRPWLDAGLPLDHLIYVPKLKYARGSREYLLAVRDGEVLILMDYGRGGVEQTLVTRQGLLAAAHTRDLLSSSLEFLWDDGMLRQVTIPFNRAREELFLPVLNTLLGAADAFGCAAAQQAAPRPAALRAQSYALYNFAGDAYRLGPAILEWRSGTLFRSRREQKKQNTAAEALACRLERGLFLLEFRGTKAAAAYYPRQDTVFSARWDEDGRPTWQLRLRGVPGTNPLARRLTLAEDTGWQPG